MSPPSPAVGSALVLYTFGDAEVDPALCELRLGGRVAPLEPRAFDVLLHLVRHRDRVVHKEELLREVWGEVRVTENVVQRCVALIRRALGDGDEARCIQTVQRRGYRFVAKVDERPSRSRAARAEAGEPRASMPEPQSPHPELTFVGRTVELARFDDALDASSHGRGRVALVVGEPGIGKTRLAECVAERARQRGARVLVGRGYDDPGVPPFWLFAQIFRGLLETSDVGSPWESLGPSAKELEPILPELRAAETAQPSRSLDVDGAARFRLFEGVASAFRRISDAQPLFVLADDLQYADRASLELLRFLLPTVQSSRILLLATVRDDAFHRDDPVAQALRAVSADASSMRVQLEGLDPAELEELMSHLAGPAWSEEWHSEAWAKTQGNPFFAREIAELWLRERSVDPRSRPAIFRLPDRLRDALSRRFAPLSPEARRVLATAALVGSPFESRLVAEVSDHDWEAVLALLAEAEALRLIVETPERRGAFAFGHALLIEALKAELPALTRARLHRRIGDALLEIVALEVGDRLEEIAHHYVEAAPVGAADRAITFSMQAGDRAMHRFAYENAEAHYARASSLLERYAPGDLAARAEASIRLGRAQHGRGAARDVLRATFRDAFRLAERAQSSSPLIDAALAFSGEADCSDPFFRTAEIPDRERVQFLDAALARCPASERVARAKLLRNRALLVSGGERPDRLELIEEAHRIAAEVGDPVLRASILLAEALVLLDQPDASARRLTLGDLAAELMRDAPHSPQWMDVYVVRAGALFECGRFDEADEEMEKMDAFAGALNKPFERSRAIQWRAMRAAMEGRFEDAERLIDAFEAAASAVFSGAEEAARAQRSKVALLRGRYEELVDRMASISGDLPYATAWRVGEARAALGLGDRARARAIVAELSRNGFASVPVDVAWSSTMAMLVDLVVDLGEEALASVLYERLLPYAGRVIVLGQTMACDGSMSRPLGRLAAMLGDERAAASHFEDALAHHARMNAEPWLAITELEYAELLLRSGDEESGSRARSLLDACVARARRIGMDRIVTKAREQSRRS